MSSSIPKRKMIINDPIFRIMHFHGSDSEKKILKAVIDSKEFQRLRRISQLGLASHVFPGATHSRFCHSLGTAYVASQILDHLQIICGDVKEIEEQRFEVILAALLHDIGHGPFSHSFEHVLSDFSKEKKANFKVMHEEWTLGIITSKESEVNNILRKNKVKISRLATPFSGKGDMELFLKQIVSSQLDADRMDYLVRDAHFSGVSLGSIDTSYLINCLTIIEHANNSKSLGLTSKGIRTYESFAFSRQLMNRSVYFHPKVKVAEYMVERLIRILIEKSPSLCKHSVYPKYFTVLYDALFNSTRLPEEALFINKNINHYLNLTDDSVYVLINFLMGKKVSKEILNLCDRIIHRRLYEHYRIVEGKASILENQLVSYGYKKGVDFEIKELKSSIYKEKDGERVFVRRADSVIESIGSQSQLISAFTDKSEGEQLLIILNEDQGEIENIKIIAEEINNCLMLPRDEVA
jgi:uncharacterized protein